MPLMHRPFAVAATAALVACACSRAAPGNAGAGPISSPDASTPPASAASDAAVASLNANEASAPTPAVPPPLGWSHPARRLLFADGPATTREDFLRAHGVKTAKPDAVCWSQGLEHCACGQTLVVETAAGPLDVLVCERIVEGPWEPPLLVVKRSVLYTVEKGASRILLDVPTEATVEAEDGPTGKEVASVALHATASGGGLTFVDVWTTDAGPWCPQSVANAAAQHGSGWAPIQRWYTAVCATAGRYSFKNGRLVKDAAAPTP